MQTQNKTKIIKPSESRKPKITPDFESAPASRRVIFSRLLIADADRRLYEEVIWKEK